MNSPSRVIPHFCFALLSLLYFGSAGTSSGNADASNNAPTLDYVVQASATVTSSPPAITISWPADSRSTSYEISRRILHSGTWGMPITMSGNPATLTTWTDHSVSVAASYEYRIVRATTIPSWGAAQGRQAPPITAYGYICAGINVPAVDHRGTVILLVDQTMAAPLAMELTRLNDDLIGDGWSVIRHDTSRTETVPNVKGIIAKDYHADPTNVRSVFLFGHIPAPYSGNLAFDGHHEHQGAWATDTYYADLDGTWTDETVNTGTNGTPPRYPENVNIPGDGKFDQAKIPGPVALEVGRVDLANMTVANTPVFMLSETELLRQYLNKDHNHRFALTALPRRGVIEDTGFGGRGGLAPAQSGWRASSALFGAGSTSVGNMRDLISKGAVFYYLCGAGYVFACGPYHTADFAANPQFEFLINFGSWFGDFDKPSNFARAALCTPYGLTHSWGLPNIFMHTMSIGGTIGEATRLSQNNDGTDYQLTRDRFEQGISTSLMGDPTLRLVAVKPPGSLSVSSAGGRSTLSWAPSPDASLGYYIYRSTTSSGPFAPVAAGVTSTTWTDATAGRVTYVYQVKAAKLETTGGGTYVNTSQAVTSQTALGMAETAAPTNVLRSAGTTPSGSAKPGPFTVLPGSGFLDGGTPVTITGMNLHGATSVTFAGVPATGITIVNPTQLTCITPSGTAGPVSVEITNPAGITTVQKAFIYLATPPVIAGIAPATGTSSGGTRVTISGTNLLGHGLAAITFGGAMATELIQVSPTQVTCVTPAHAGGDVEVNLINLDSSAKASHAFTYEKSVGDTSPFQTR